MKGKLITGIIILVVIIGGFFYFRSPGSDVKKPSGQNNGSQGMTPQDDGHYVDNEIGFSFQYPGGKDTYIVQEPPVTEDGKPTILSKAVILISAADFKNLQTGAAGNQEPPTMSILIFPNTQGLTPTAWLNTSKNSLILSGPNDKEIGGEDGIEFTTKSGSYEAQNVVIAKDGFLYFISGQYSDTNSAIYKDFKTLVGTLSFNSNVTTSGSISKIGTASDGSQLFTITNERGTMDTISIPLKASNLCEAGNKISDADGAQKGDIIRVYGERNSKGHIVPCNSQDYYFGILN